MDFGDSIIRGFGPVWRGCYADWTRLLRAQQIDLEMHLARGKDGAAGAAGAFVEPDYPGGGELV